MRKVAIAIVVEPPLYFWSGLYRSRPCQRIKIIYNRGVVRITWPILKFYNLSVV